MEVVLRSTVIFFFIWLLTRAMGRRELSEMTAFELLLLVTIGDFVQQGVTQEDQSVTGAILAVGTLACWSLVFSYVTFRWRRTETVLAGIPVVVVRDGRPLEDVLRLERIPLDEVLQAARMQGIDDLELIRVGIIEADGRFSFIRHDDKEPSTEERRHTE
jgi:uncharacterized membrane protein YcaP (DUF421 family)